MSKRNWFPHFHQVDMARNDSWKHSAWLGLTTPLILLPQIVFLVAWPIISGFVAGVWRILVILMAFPILGLLGRMNSNYMTMEQRQELIRKRRISS